MKMNLRHLVALGAAALAIQLNASAQNFTNNTGGSYNASCTATIKMKADAGKFNGTDSLGATSAKRVAGTVDWASGVGPQAVQGLYYTNLTLSGASTKTLADGVHVGGTNSCTQAYTAATSGARTYLGTFYYDGSGAQTIFAESGSSGTTNEYNNLSLSGGGLKTLNGATNLIGALADTSGTNLTLNANLTYGSGASLIAGTINVENLGGLTATGTGTTSNTGTINVNAGGSLALNSTGLFTNSGTIALAAQTGLFAQGAGSNLISSGAFTNAGDGVNATYACDATTEFSGSTYLASATPSMANYVAGNRYGLLRFSGASNKTQSGGTNGSLYVCGNVNFADGAGNLILGATTASTNVLDVDVTGDAPNTAIAYMNDTTHINGKVRLSGTLQTEGLYAMNNRQTKLSFKDVAGLSNVQLDVIPGSAPSKASDYNPNKDVVRTVEMSFAGTGSIDTLRVGYTAAEVAGLDIVHNPEANMRFAEAFDAAVPATLPAQKLVGGSGVATNSGAANPRFVNLASPTNGISLVASATNGGTTSQFVTGSQLMMTSAPNMFYATTPGRWTNTKTWDEGTLPTENDNVEIRTYVYAGIKSDATNGQAFGTSMIGNDISEVSQYPIDVSNPNGKAVANSITIASGTLFPNSALIIGNEDNTAPFVFHTAMTNTTVGGIASGFYNNNTQSQDVAWTGFTYTKATTPENATPANAKPISGLFISNLTFGSGNSVIFGTSQITNNGPISNHDGTIEVSK